MTSRVFAAALLLALSAPSGAGAAVYTWDSGCGNGNWNCQGNWDPDGVPGAGDDARIAAADVYVSASSPALQVGLLTIGDGASLASLRLSTTAAHIATVTVRGKGTLVFDNDYANYFSSVTVEPGGVLTHSGPLALSTSAVRIVVDSFELKAGASVSLQGKGFAGGLAISSGSGPGGGRFSDANGANGAGCANSGGKGSGNIFPAGAAYGSAAEPDELGSGGGGMFAPSYGGAGGGLFRLEAGTAVINGLVNASGVDGIGGGAFFGGGGGGSGGGIFIRASYLHGAGTMTVAGGNGGQGASFGGGAGSGGRLALAVTGENYSRIVISSGGGAGGTGAGGTANGENAGSASTFLDPKLWMGGAGDGSLCGNPDNWFARLPPQDGENLVFASTGAAAGCLWNMASVLVGSATFRPEYQGRLRVSTVMRVSGRFQLQGGTVTMTAPVELELGGDASATGGYFELAQGSFVLTGAWPQTLSFSSRSSFNHFYVNATTRVIAASDLNVAGNLTVRSGAVLVLSSGTVLKSSGAVTALGTMSIDAGHRLLLAGNAAQRLILPSVGILQVANPAGVGIPTGSTLSVQGGVFIDSGAALSFSSAALNVYGDWSNLGSFSGPGSTVAFLSASTQSVLAGGSFWHLHVNKAAYSLKLTTPTLVTGNLTLSTGALELGGLEHRLRGSFLQSSATLSCDGSTLTLDGSGLQTVQLASGASFHHLISSSAGGVRLLTHAAMSGNLLLERGRLDLSSMAVSIGGDFANYGGSALGVNRSTVTLGGVVLQTVALGATDTLDSLVVSNTGPGVKLATTNLKVRRNFTVSPGSVFDGGGSTLTLQGAGGLWTTTGADYRDGGGHGIQWSASPLYVAAGSTVSGRIQLSGRAELQGNLLLQSTSLLLVQAGAALNALSSTITLQGTADLAFSSVNARYGFDPGSWIVYEGGGVNRGHQLSTGPFANIRFSPAAPTDSFMLSSAVFTGSLVLERGVLKSSSSAVLTLHAHLLNRGGTLDLAGASTSTVRFAGSSEQRVLTSTGDRFWRFEAASSESVALSTVPLEVRENLLLSRGRLNAGSALVALKGDWTGTGGVFEAQTSTVVFAAPAAGARQTLNDPSGPVFNGLWLHVSTAVFQSTFTAAVLVSTRAGNLVVFPHTGTSTVSDLTVNASSQTPTRIRLRSDLPGARWGLRLVSRSTVAFADVQDSSATAGLLVHANDETSVDAGGNLHWNFKPLLVVLAPGETFVERSGKSGSPAAQVAGSAFTVTVRAVSASSSTAVGSSMTVTLATDDPFDEEPASRALALSVATFSVVLRTAEPLPKTALLSATGPRALGAGSAAPGVIPSGYHHVLVLLPGEDPLPGSPLGRVNDPDLQTQASPFPLVVRAVDQFNNLLTGVAADRVSAYATTASSFTRPSTAPFASGVVVLEGMVVYSTGVVTVSVSDLDNGTVFVNTSSTFPVFALATTSPTAAFAIPRDAVAATLGGRLAGTAYDAVAVARVDVALKDDTLGLYYDWASGAFTSASPALIKTNVSPSNGSRVDWSLPFDESKLTSGRGYYVLVKSSNPSRLIETHSTRFTFDTSSLVFGAADGKGSASMAPLVTPACQPVVATITFTAGAGGLQPGGALALRIPDGWTRPLGVQASSDPALGYLHVESTSAVWSLPGATEMLLEPPSLGSVTLGGNWLVLRVLAGAGGSFLPGEQIRFVYNGFPPARRTGDQVFDLRTQGGASGSLAPISSVPKTWIAAGAARSLAFTSSEALRVGPLQASPALQVRLSDACGNPAAAVSTVTVALSAGVFGTAGFSRDDSAEFFRSGAAASSVRIFTGQEISESFTYQTSTSGIACEHLRATATVAGAFADASRLVVLLSTPAVLQDASVSTGAQVLVRFTLADADVPWDLVVSTDPVHFGGALFAASGMGDAQRPVNVAWNAVVCAEGGLCRSADPGTYSARLQAAGGSDSLVLPFTLARTASVSGNLGFGGARASVRAEGPGAGLGSYAVATSTGHFRIYGLSAGQTYSVSATTLSAAYGQAVLLSTGASWVQASLSGGDAGSLSFPAPSFIRVNVGVPLVSPFESWGAVRAHDAGYARLASGSLHIASGSAISDDGGQALGRSASTWTVLSLPPGTYDLDVEFYRLRLSTSLRGVSLAEGAVRDVHFDLPRRANLFGLAVLASTAPAATWVSVKAFRSGEEGSPVYGGASVPPSASTGVYSLYGLEPGSWTLQASAAGWLSTSAVLAVSGQSDIGDPSSGAGGPSLTLSTGGVLRGSVRVEGNSSSFRRADGRPGFGIQVNAFHPETFTTLAAEVSLSTSSTSTSSTFSLSGVLPGEWQLSMAPLYFDKVPAGPTRVVVTSTYAPVVALSQVESPARARIDVRLPPLSGGLCRSSAGFESLGFYAGAPGRSSRASAAITDLDGQSGASATYHCSSMTFLSPPYALAGLAAPYRFSFAYGPSGQMKSFAVPLRAGATVEVVADLSGATVAVTGTLTLSGAVQFARGSYSVSVSSVGGLLAYSTSSAWCLLSSSQPKTLSSLRMELVPLNPDGTRPGSLVPYAGSCRSYEVSADAAGRTPPLLAYVSSVSVDGSFRFDGVAPGVYLLRNSRDIDGSAANGEELADASSVVRVDSATQVSVRVGDGSAVAGRIWLPAESQEGRPVLVSLKDASSATLRSVVLGFPGGRYAAYAFDRLADGRYTVSAEDAGFPKAFAARPLKVEVAGADLGGQDLFLARSGAIKGRIAVEALRPDGSVESRLVSAADRSLLPKGLRLFAVADPWVEGGFYEAAGDGAAGDPASVAIDGEGQFNITGILPGVYALQAQPPASPEGLAPVLVGEALGGVQVVSGLSTEAGTLRLRSAVSLSGRVADEDGQGLADVLLVARPAVRSSGQTSGLRGHPSARTDAEGAFVLSGLDPGVQGYDVTAADRGDLVRPGDAVPAFEQKSALFVSPRSTTTLLFQLARAPYSVSGRVVGKAGAALQAPVGDGSLTGAAVFVLKQGDIPVKSPLGDLVVLTDERGDFTVSNLSAGVYKLSVSALDHALLSRVVLVSTSAALGSLNLDWGAGLSGAILRSDGAAPSEDEVVDVFAATPDLEEVIPGTLVRDPNTRTVVGYRLSGFRQNVGYRVLLMGRDGQLASPSEASYVLFTSSLQARQLDLALRIPRPTLQAKSKRSGQGFLIDVIASSPLRARSAQDDELASFLTTASARGSLSAFEMSSDRRRVSALYQPGVGESSFTLRFTAFSSLRDPDAAGGEFLHSSTLAFYQGLDGLNRNNVNNLTGGAMALDSDPGRLTFPKGAFAVDASSTVEVSFQSANENLAARRVQAAGLSAHAAALKSLRFGASAYPSDILKAMAATPPEMTPLSAFYDVLLPLGMRTALARPVELSVHYSTGVDPASLNVYWYNPAANAYILQQDVTGAAPTIDPVNRTLTIRVNHFSTFVLFDTNVAVISGNAFSGGGIDAFCFPNPFDLNVKTVTPTHGAPAQEVRGTMVRFALPPDVGGEGRLNIFNVAGERVRSISLGNLAGGRYYYQGWDGRSDSGRDVASGVYLGQVKVGGAFKFFKMALIK